MEKGFATAKEETFTWGEVKLHNKQENNWIVINDHVYDVTRWFHRHPGGSDIITHYAGQDASEAFSIFHTNMVYVGRYLKAFHIGKMEPTESNIQEEEMRKDYEEIRRTAKNMGLYRASMTFFTLSICQVFILEWLALWVLQTYDTDWVSFFLAVCIFATSQGASADWWNEMHLQHHVKPNIMDKDPTVNMEDLLVIGDEMAKKVAMKKNRIMAYNWQHHYFFMTVPPLLFPIYFQFMSFIHPIQKRKYMDLFILALAYVRFFFFLYPLFNSIPTLLGFYFLARVIESSWFTWVSLSNHLPMVIESDKDRPWLPLQIQAICNIESTAFNNWFSGHLTNHIEHHLFPMMPRHNYSRVAPLVRNLCLKHGLKYEVKPMWTAFRDLVMTLKHSGELWEYYYHAYHSA